jgi:hypothetical protein
MQIYRVTLKGDRALDGLFFSPQRHRGHREDLLFRAGDTDRNKSLSPVGNLNSFLLNPAYLQVN